METKDYFKSMNEWIEIILIMLLLIIYVPFWILGSIDDYARKIVEWLLNKII